MNNKEAELLKTHGFVIIRNFISKNKIVKLKNEVEKVSKKYGIPKIFEKKEMNWWKENFEHLNSIKIELNYRNKVFRDFYKYKKLFSKTETLIKKKSKKFKVDKVRFNVPNKHNQIYPWHQDEITWPDKLNKKPITFWVPLVSVNKKNGLELFITKPKISNLLPHKFGKNPKTKLKYATIRDKKFIHKTICPNLKIGDVIVFDNFLAHRSCPNVTNKLRISIDTRFM